MLERAVERGAIALAGRTSRRSFLGRLGTAVVALAGGRFVAEAVRPELAGAHHICGHTYTTNSCPHPYAPLTRIDHFGYPIHPKFGYPVDDHGELYTSRDQPRSKTCQTMVPSRYPYTGDPRYGGGWSRCCHGQIRRIHDCCSYSDKRINGDASVRGYCYGGRKVFCIAYRDTNIPC